MLHWYQRVYLPDDILVKGDRASMRHGLELRAPLLDVDLADFVNRLPITAKVRGGTRKHLLRRLLARWGAEPASAPLRHPLPAHVLRRPKKGFGIPVATWLRGPLRRDLEDTLLHQWPEPLAVISATARRQLVAEHVAGRRNAAKELWALLTLAWWTRAWIPS
jgi:asparagine synthase (glutamine-hydrolysing)